MKTNRVADLTLEELEAFIQKVVYETINGFLAIDDTPDEDEGLDLHPEVADELKTALHEKKRGKPLRQVLEELGFADTDTV